MYIYLSHGLFNSFLTENTCTFTSVKPLYKRVELYSQPTITLPYLILHYTNLQSQKTDISFNKLQVSNFGCFTN